MKVLEARSEAEAIVVNAQRGIDPTEAARRARSTPTLGEVVDLYFAKLDRWNRATRTLSTYRGRWRRYGQALARLKVDRITLADVDELHRPIAATAEAGMMIRLLRAVLSWSKHPARGWVTSNPAAEFEPHRRRRRRTDRSRSGGRPAAVMQVAPQG